MKKIVIVLFLMLFGFTQAQQSPYISDNGLFIFNKKDNSPDKYTGSPYYEDDFIPGTIIDEKGRTQAASLRYNALDQTVEIKLEGQGDKVVTLPKVSSLTYSLDGYTYFIDNLNTDKGYINSYFARYYDGEEVSFIGHPYVDVAPGREANNGYEKAKAPRIRVIMDYFIQVNDGQYQEVRLKEKDFAKIFKSDRMEKYMDDHKIKSEQDVVEMLKFYEQNS